MGVWPASAPQRGEDPLDLTTRCRCSEKRALLTPGSAGRDWPHRTQNALLDKDLIMGVMLPMLCGHNSVQFKGDQPVG